MSFGRYNPEGLFCHLLSNNVLIYRKIAFFYVINKILLLHRRSRYVWKVTMSNAQVFLLFPGHFVKFLFFFSGPDLAQCHHRVLRIVQHSKETSMRKMIQKANFYIHQRIAPYPTFGHFTDYRPFSRNTTIFPLAQFTSYVGTI